MSEQRAEQIQKTRAEAVAALRADGLDRAAAKLVAEGIEAAILSMFWWDAPGTRAARRALCRLYLAETEPGFRVCGVMLAGPGQALGDVRLVGDDALRVLSTLAGPDVEHLFPVPSPWAARFFAGDPLSAPGEPTEAMAGCLFRSAFLDAVRRVYPEVTWAVGKLKGALVAAGYDGVRLVAIVCEVREDGPRVGLAPRSPEGALGGVPNVAGGAR